MRARNRGGPPEVGTACAGKERLAAPRLRTRTNSAGAAGVGGAVVGGGAAEAGAEAQAGSDLARGGAVGRAGYRGVHAGGTPDAVAADQHVGLPRSGLAHPAGADRELEAGPVVVVEFLLG